MNNNNIFQLKDYYGIINHFGQNNINMYATRTCGMFNVIKIDFTNAGKIKQRIKSPARKVLVKKKKYHDDRSWKVDNDYGDVADNRTSKLAVVNNFDYYISSMLVICIDVDYWRY